MPSGVYKRTEEHKKLISQYMKGHPISNETKIKIGNSNRGKIRSIEAKKKNSESHKGKKQKYETIIKRMSNPNVKKTFFKKGHKVPEKCLRKGEQHPSWKGGKICKVFANARYRARKRNAKGSHTLGEWEHLKALYNWTCPACWKKVPEITLSEDHIIPLVKGGSDFIENIQPLCRSCNSKKKNKTIEKYNFF